MGRDIHDLIQKLSGNKNKSSRRKKKPPLKETRKEEYKPKKQHAVAIVQADAPDAAVHHAATSPDDLITVQDTSIANLTSTLKTLTSEVKERRSSHAQRLREIEELRNQLKFSNYQFQKITETKLLEQRECFDKRINSERTAMGNKISALEKNCSQLQSQLEEERKTKNDFVKTSEEKCSQLQFQLEAEKNRIKNLEIEYAQVEKEKNANSNQINQCAQQIDHERKTANDQITAGKDRFKNLEKEHAEYVSQVEGEKKANNDRVNQLHEELAQIEQQMIRERAAANDQITAWKDRIKILEKEGAEYLSQVEGEKKANNDQVNQLHEELTQVKQQMIRERAAVNDRITVGTNHISNLTEELSQLRIQVENEIAAKNDLQSQLIAEQNKSNHLNHCVTSIKEEATYTIDGLKQQITRLKNGISSLQSSNNAWALLHTSESNTSNIPQALLPQGQGIDVQMDPATTDIVVYSAGSEGERLESIPSDTCPYELYKVGPKATMDELKSARAKLLLVHHPDKNHLDDKDIAEANSRIIIRAFIALEKTVQLLSLPSPSLTKEQASTIIARIQNNTQPSLHPDSAATSPYITEDFLQHPHQPSTSDVRKGYKQKRKTKKAKVKRSETITKKSRKSVRLEKKKNKQVIPGNLNDAMIDGIAKQLKGEVVNYPSLAEEEESLDSYCGICFEEESSDNYCGICFEEFDRSDGVILQTCFHVFCKACIVQVRECKCPHCRVEYRETDINNME